MRGLNLENSKKLRRFDAVRKEVGDAAALKNPDLTLEMERMRITPELNVEVPGAGTFKMTDWAQKQLGTLLGIQWNKWFDPKLVKAEEIQQELQRRFSKTHDQRKLRTNRFREGAPGAPNCDGYLRAVLSPTYHPIDDERIFDRLEKKFIGALDEISFMNNHLSKKSRWGNDHCNYYTMVGKPVNMGAIDRNHPDPDVRHIYDIAEREGALPTDDLIYPGYTMRNSEVGYTAVIIDEFSFRLVCLNGMMITTGDSRLLYRRHVPIEDAALDAQFNQAFERAPLRWEKTRKLLASSQTVIVEEPEKFLDDELKRLEAPKHFREAAIKAFAQEPLKTGYGMVQAITRAAQNYEDMDKRFEFEELAGRVLQRASA